jgi:hypothetical protein
VDAITERIEPWPYMLISSQAVEQRFVGYTANQARLNVVEVGMVVPSVAGIRRHCDCRHDGGGCYDAFYCSRPPLGATPISPTSTCPKPSIPMACVAAGHEFYDSSADIWTPIIDADDH